VDLIGHYCFEDAVLDSGQVKSSLRLLTSVE
jgi:hypothetical protein